MLARIRRKSFSDYFSPTDVAHVNWMSGNARTLLTQPGQLGPRSLGVARDIEGGDSDESSFRFAAEARKRVESLGDSRTFAHAADTLIQSGSLGRDGGHSLEEAMPWQFVIEKADEINAAPRAEQPAVLGALLRMFDSDLVEAVAKQFAQHVPTSVLDAATALARTGSGTMNGFLPMGGDEGAGPRDRRPPQQREVPKPPPPPSPPLPREHPLQAQRDAERKAACEDLKRQVGEALWHVDWLSRQRDRLRVEGDRLVRNWDQTKDKEIARLEQELAQAEWELTLLNLAPPDKPPCVWVWRGRRRVLICEPGLGPIPEATKHQMRLDLEKKIADLKRRIAELRSRKFSAEWEENRRKMREICAQLDTHIPITARLQEQYEQKMGCGLLSSWRPEWRTCNAGERAR